MNSNSFLRSNTMYGATKNSIVNQDPTHNESKVHLTTSANTTSLKNKLGLMQEDLLKVSYGIKSQKGDISGLNSKKQEITDYLNIRSQEVQVTLMKELDIVRDEMKKGFANQMSENLRLKQQITQLSSEEVSIKSQIAALEKRIRDIESQVGEIDN